MTGSPRWESDGWAYHPTNVDEVLFALNRIGTWGRGRRYAFRGVKNHQWPIRSSLQIFMRDQIGEFSVSSETRVREVERQIIALARDWKVDDGGDASDHAVLARLQHHGTPTRLVDVTSDPMTALWFATEPYDEWGAHGVVFAFDITSMEEIVSSPAPSAPTHGSIADSRGWHYEHAIEQSTIRSRPFVVRPYPRDHRMAAQQGFFLAGVTPADPEIGGVDAFPLTAEAPGAVRLSQVLGMGGRQRGFPARIPFVAVIVPKSLKGPIRNALASTWDRRRETLFPDLAGLADAIKAEPHRATRQA